MKKGTKVSVILMTYGSPKTLADVPEYLKNVYGGREPSQENIAEFRRRYGLIGGSPLISITQEQAVALEKELQKEHKDQLSQVRAGMRFSHPFIAEVVQNIAKDADIIVGIIMSPQYSSIIMSGYVKTLTESVNMLDRDDLKLAIAGDWHTQPYFLQALAERVREAVAQLPKNVQQTTPVLFSAHSMPKRVIDKDPKYIDDLKETAREVARLSGLPPDRWQFCYQSAGHTPEEWLKPDFADIIPELAKKGQTHVLIAPVQFLSDHLEILYDVNIAAREQAEKYHMTFVSTKSLNTSPLFIKALADVVMETIKKAS